MSGKSKPVRMYYVNEYTGKMCSGMTTKQEMREWGGCLSPESARKQAVQNARASIVGSIDDMHQAKKLLKKLGAAL